MSTTRCVTVLLALVRSRIVPATLTAVNLLLNNSNLVIAVIVAVAEIVVALRSQTRPAGGHVVQAQVSEDRTYRETNAASSACTS